MAGSKGNAPFSIGSKPIVSTCPLTPYMVDLAELESTTSSLQEKLSPIEIQTHIMLTLFKILCELNYEMLTFRRIHGYIVY